MAGKPNAHLWVNVSTGEYIATDYKSVKEQDRYYNIGSSAVPGGHYAATVGDIGTLYGVQTSGDPRVNYNKTSGKWIKINYYRSEELVEGVYGVEVDSFSDDFLVENGAKFIFNLPVGQKVLIVGEQFPDIPASEATVIFDGTWRVDTSTWMFYPPIEAIGCRVLEQRDIRNKWEISCWAK
jgi:hypothetical protein